MFAVDVRWRKTGLVRMKVLRFVAGVVLVPFCGAATWTVIRLLASLQPDRIAHLPPSAWALGGGFLFWLTAFFALPRPMRAYILAHELTHALWGALMGARVSRLHVSRASGSVTLSRNNVWITLAPYFFPLYTMLVIAAYHVLAVFFDVEAYAPVWLALIGCTWGFHLTFTLHTLLQRQSDIEACGHVFSYVLIYLLNVMGIALWIVMVTPARLEDLVGLMREHLALALQAAAAAAGRLAQTWAK